jgi:hypothetical protein
MPKGVFYSRVAHVPAAGQCVAAFTRLRVLPSAGTDAHHLDDVAIAAIKQFSQNRAFRAQGEVEVLDVQMWDRSSVPLGARTVQVRVNPDGSLTAKRIVQGHLQGSHPQGQTAPEVQKALDLFRLAEETKAQLQELNLIWQRPR